jgi:hypothetical protein
MLPAIFGGFAGVLVSAGTPLPGEVRKVGKVRKTGRKQAVAGKTGSKEG